MIKAHPTPQSRLQLLDTVMTGRLNQQKQVADRFVKVVGEYTRK